VACFRYGSLFLGNTVNRWLQSILVRIGSTPFESMLRRAHAFAVRRAVSALSSHPAVVCVLGGDSFFEDYPAFSFWEVDLIVVLSEQVSRSDSIAAEIAYRYERVRRTFRFLGRWREKETNMVFLSDIAAGFPAPDSLCLRLKQGRVKVLYGELPRRIAGDAVTISELLNEINMLLRLSLLADPREARRLLFWKRIFARLSATAHLLGLGEESKEICSCADLAFLAEDDRRLFFREAQCSQLFSLQLAFTRQIFNAVESREPKAHIRLCAKTARTASQPVEPVPFSSFLNPPADQRLAVKTIPSIPFGLSPTMLYFSIDESITVVQLHDAAYVGLRRLLQTAPWDSEKDENALVSAEGFLFLATRRGAAVDLLPLDPVQFANVYAAIFNGSLDFEMPVRVLAEQQAAAAAIFSGLAQIYRVNDGVVKKLSFPCIYREHDIEVIEEALSILRVRIAFEANGVLLQRAEDLFDYLRHRYPECAPFLSELENFRNSLRENSSAVRSAFNNCYHCLHQFMHQVLTGANTITIDSPSRHLGITVGVITRNRASDLAEMLESLTHQSRVPDEVLVVDNGSTDATQDVLEGFSDRLPIRRHFLEVPDIPRARNLVLELAEHDIVSFIDDDCLSEPEWLAAVEAGFLHGENIGVVGGWVTHEPAMRRSTVENYYRVFHHLKS
jgi:hypothetical protein